jgi:hypothetical protein
MKISKKSNTYDDYVLDVSFTELSAILGGLESDHTGPVADEVYSAIRWYVERLPEPGSEETKLRSLEKPAEKKAENGDFPEIPEEGFELDKDLPEPPTEA